MKMNKYIVLFFLIILGGVHIYAQKVSNISFRQEQSNIIVSYELETEIPCSVNLYVSMDGGINWQGPLIKVNGGVGNNIETGKHDITWNVLDEIDEFKGNNILFRVFADGEEINKLNKWMSTNLNVERYRNGDIIPEVKDREKWKYLRTGAWCYYNNDSNNGEKYGKLYNWYAVNDPRGLAPKGFHVATKSEWSSLIELLNNKTNKIELNQKEKILSKFTIHSGYRDINNFSFNDFRSYWWLKSDITDYVFELGNNDFTLSMGASKVFGYSVRCVKD